MTEIRVNITFSLHGSKVSEDEIKERLDTLLVEYFQDCENWNARWVERLEESPLFGVAGPAVDTGAVDNST